MTRNATFRAPFHPLTLAAVLALAVLVLAAPAAAASFDALAEDYEAVRMALLEDSTDGVADHASAMEDELAAFLDGFDATSAGVSADQAEAARSALEEARTAAAALADASSLEVAREAFGDLSRPLVRWYELRGRDGDLAVTYCPMVKKSWLQPADLEVGNPYHGQSMPRCGRFVGEG